VILEHKTDPTKSIRVRVEEQEGGKVNWVDLPKTLAFQMKTFSDKEQLDYPLTCLSAILR